MRAYAGTPIAIPCVMDYVQTERRILAWLRQEQLMDPEGKKRILRRRIRELEDKLAARDGECDAKARIITQLEGSVRRRDRRIEYQRARDGRNRDTFMRMRDEVHRLRERVNPLKHGGPDVREVIGLYDTVEIGTKHRGETLRRVADEDPTWVTWLENEHSTHRPSPMALQRAKMAIGRMRREAARRAIMHVDIETDTRDTVAHQHHVEVRDADAFRAAQGDIYAQVAWDISHYMK